jgi:hypothetical protein
VSWWLCSGSSSSSEEHRPEKDDGLRSSGEEEVVEDDDYEFEERIVRYSSNRLELVMCISVDMMQCNMFVSIDDAIAS